MAAADLVEVNLGQRMINSRSSGMVILLTGLNSKIRFMMESNSAEIGRMDLRNLGSFM